MKRLKTKIALGGLGLLLFASCTTNDATVSVKGLEEDLEEVTLTKTGVDIGNYAVTDAQTQITVKEVVPGYYNLNGTLLYLEPGFELNINQEDGTVFSGKGQKENTLLQKRILTEKGYDEYQDSISKKFAMGEKDFFAYLDEMEANFDKELEDSELSKWFVIVEQRRSDQIKRKLIESYAYKHGVDDNVVNQYMAFMMSLPPDGMTKPENLAKFDSLRTASRKNAFSKEKIKEFKELVYDGFDWDDEELYAMNSASRNGLFKGKLMSGWQKRVNSDKEKYSIKEDDYLPQVISHRDIVIDSVTNPTVKASMLTQYTSIIIKTASEFADDAYEKFTASNPSKSQLKSVNTIYENYQKLKPGTVSAEFVDYKTPEDKPVSLSDFKGKYVYIDVWATWCGPCKKEIPYLKEVEKKYHDKNIEFVSISVDVEKQRDAWKKMVADMELKGVQIMADKDFSSDFIKAYNIAAIPRFILIDPEGKIVNSDALRPSDPALTVLLDGMLNI